MPYYVSRQHYYYSGEFAVEVAMGGIDYTGCDMLGETGWSRQYTGEYENPIAAMMAAIELVQEWEKKQPDKKISLVYGGLLDMLEPECLGIDRDQAMLWARREYEKLDKCPECGGIMPENKRDIYYLEFEPDIFYCSERCADHVWERDYNFDDSDIDTD